MKKPIKEHFITALLFTLIACVQYYSVIGYIFERLPSPHKFYGVLCFQLLFFLIAIPLFRIIVPRCKFQKNFIYRVLIGAFIGLASSKITVIVAYWGVPGVIVENIQIFNFLNFIAVTFFQAFLCAGIIPGCLYIEVAYRLTR